MIDQHYSTLTEIDWKCNTWGKTLWTKQPLCKCKIPIQAPGWTWSCMKTQLAKLALVRLSHRPSCKQEGLALESRLVRLSWLRARSWFLPILKSRTMDISTPTSQKHETCLLFCQNKLLRHLTRFLLIGLKWPTVSSKSTRKSQGFHSNQPHLGHETSKWVWFW